MGTKKGGRVAIDPRLEALWKHEIAALEAADDEGFRAWDEKWEAAARIIEHSPPLYAVGGFRNAAAFLKGVLGENVRQAGINMRVAKNATPQDEKNYTVTRLNAALAYYEAAHGPLPRGVKLNYASMKIVVRAKPKALKDCSLADLNHATRALRAKQTGKKPAELRAYEDAITKALAKHPALKEVRVHEARGRVSFHDVPNASLDVFAFALSKTKTPKP